MADTTNTRCPYCSTPQMGQARYIYRLTAVDGQFLFKIG